MRRPQMRARARMLSIVDIVNGSAGRLDSVRLGDGCGGSGGGVRRVLASFVAEEAEEPAPVPCGDKTHLASRSACRVLQETRHGTRVSHKSERARQIGVFVPGKRASHSLPTPGGRDADTAPSHARRSQA